ncbi:MAG: DUF4832 domain-containing protein [Muribaculaceae bacterium]|nr:DUF4832 domain-containing protein [Muribaculaceae bacterium]
MFYNNHIQNIANRMLPIAAGLTLTIAGASCSDDDPAENAAGWEIPGNEVVDIKPERYKLLRNPMTGWVLYAGLGDGLSDTFWEDYDNFDSEIGKVKVSDYAHTLFIRGAWSDFNPEEGKYVWNEGQLDTKPAKRFKMLVDGAKARGMKLAFSFICDSQDKHYDFSPKYVKDAGAKGYVSTTGSVQVWSPYPDDPVFQEKYANFIRDFAARWDNPDETMFVSGFGLGKWGESHTARYSTGNAEPREAVIDWVSDVYTSCVKRVPLLINFHRCLLTTTEFSEKVDARTEPILLNLIEKGYSLRHDAFGMKTYYTTWERNFAASQRYKRPIVAEGGWVKGSHGGSIKGDGYADYGEVRYGEYYEARGANANMMDFRYNSNLSWGETWSWFNEAYELVEEFIQEGGYRLYPDKVSVPVSVAAGGNVSVTHRWSNLGWGYCPTNIPQWNQKYKVAFALLDPSSQQPVAVYVDKAPELNTWIKGKPSTYNTQFNIGGVGAGEYIWAVGLVDTTKDNEIGLQIAAKENVTPEGWVKLRNVTVR